MLSVGEGLPLLLMGELLMAAMMIAPAYGYNKCCGKGQALGRNIYKMCVNYEKATGLNYSEARLPLLGKTEFLSEMNCSGYDISDYRENISSIQDGKLVTLFYRDPVPPEEFCVEQDLLTGNLKSVTCDPCIGKGKLCLHLCCGFDQIFNDSCVDRPQQAIFPKPEFVNQNGDISNWEEGENYVLKYPHPGFDDPEYSYQCKDKRTPPQVVEGLNFTLRTDGNLTTMLDGSMFTFEEGNYCMYFEKADESVEATLRHGYVICDEEPPGQCEETYKIYHPVGISISLVFIILTLAAHLIEKSLKDSPIGKITVAFLINLAVSFSLILESRLNNLGLQKGTTMCTVYGYFLQYFFISFVTWINIMGINIRMAFSGSKSSLKPGSNKELLAYALYGQGLPLLVCLITLIVDNTSKNAFLRPGMGKFQCFLGQERTEEHPSYFETPAFIYFQSVIILLILSNIVFFILTAKDIMRTRMSGVIANAITDEANRKRRKENIIIIVKLFMIMVAGWVCDVVTSAIEMEYGARDTYCIRMGIDTFNLFYGLLIFVVLVCKKSTLRSLKTTISTFTTYTTTSTDVPLETISK